MPKSQDKSAMTGKANVLANQAKCSGEAGGRLPPEDVVGAIKELKDDLKSDDEGLRREFSLLGQEISSKLDSLTAEVQNLAGRVTEAETRVERLEQWCIEATEVIATCRDYQNHMERKLIDLESRSRRNNIRIRNLDYYGWMLSDVMDPCNLMLVIYSYI